MQRLFTRLMSLTLVLSLVMGSGTMLNVASAATDGDYEYTDNGDGTATITGYTGTSKELVIPSEINGLTVTEIGDDAFNAWKNKSMNPLEIVSIPESIIGIGNSAFFYNQLTRITIPDSIKTIGDNAFEKNQLTEVTLPDGITNLGIQAFSDNKLTSVSLPSGLTSPAYGAFSFNQIKNVSIADGTTSIAPLMFATNQIESITIPDSVTSIGFQAFSSNQLETITLPDSVASIGENAFERNHLTEITLLNSSTVIENSAFSNNQSNTADLTIVGYASSTAQTLADANGHTFVDILTTPRFTLQRVVNGDGTITITGYTGSNKTIEIPGMLDGLSVTEIGGMAFFGKGLTDVSLPDSVTNIGYGAFSNNLLEQITLPDRVTSLGDYAFSLNRLTSVTIPSSVESIEEGVFHGNLLTDVTIPSSVTSIGVGAFWENELKHMTIPESVKSIGDRAFAINAPLTIVEILNKETSFGDLVFVKSISEGDITIIGRDGSTAQQYAHDNDHAFVNGDGEVTFSPNGNPEWKKEQTVTVAVYGVDEVQYGWSSVAGEPPVSWISLDSGKSNVVNFDLAASGEGVVWVKGTNLFGEEVIQVTSVFKLDHDTPKLTIMPSTTTNTNKDVVLTVQATDEHSGVKRIQKPDGSWVIGKSLAYTAQHNGTYTFTVEDNAGNTATKSITIDNIHTTKPVITLKGPQPFIVSFGDTFEEPGYTASDYLGADLHDQVVVTGSVDVTKLGSYQLTYTVVDSSGNQTSVIRTVVVFDSEAPVITLKGDNPLTLEVGTPYMEPGYIATDNAVGDLIDQVEIESNVDTAILGEYEIHYSVTDSVYSFEITRYVHVVDTTAPIITLNPGVGGVTDMKLNVGEVFNDPGAVAADNYDHVVIVTANNTVNTNEPGTYTVTYTAMDSSGNTAAATRKVKVTNPGSGSDPGTGPGSGSGSEPGNDPGTDTSPGNGTDPKDVGEQNTDDVTGQDAMPPLFSDVDGHWAATSIKRGVELGIAVGYPDGAFQPDHSVSRLEFTAMLLRALGWEIMNATEGTPFNFADRESIPPWGLPYVRAALQFDFIHGYSDGTFRPEQPITRAEMMVMIARAFGLPEADTSELGDYDDYLDVPAWAVEAVASVVQSGYIQGRTAEQLAPNATTTRAEVITILVRVYDSLR